MLARKHKARSGASAVEFAFMAPVVLLILFGILEFGRLICVQQLTENAARTGARYAVVNTNDVNLVTDTVVVVNNAMCGFQTQLTPYNTPTVFLANASGQNVGTATNATFGQYIGVNVSGTYHPAMTTFLGLSANIPVNTTAIMCSEAN